MKKNTINRRGTEPYKAPETVISTLSCEGIICGSDDEIGGTIDPWKPGSDNEF